MDAERLASRYQDAYAAKYDVERTRSEVWQREQAAIEAFLGRLEPGSTLLDIPVGTGRFGKLYARYGIRATGIDSSSAMLAQTRRKGLQMELRLGDIRAIDAPDGAFDASLCIRLFNWFEPAMLPQPFGELVRVSRRYVIFGVQHYLPAGEVHLPRLLRQWKRRFYMGRRRSEFVYHETPRHQRPHPDTRACAPPTRRCRASSGWGRLKDLSRPQAPLIRRAGNRLSSPAAPAMPFARTICRPSSVKMKPHGEGTCEW